MNAKDGSQETLVGILGMVSGSLIVTLLDDTHLWLIALFLTVCHLISNYLAVHSVILTTLNRHRLTLICQEYCKSKTIPTPLQINAMESIWQHSPQSIYFGVSLRYIMSKDPNLVKRIFNSKKQHSTSQIKEYQGTIYILIHSNAQMEDLIYLYSKGVFLSMNCNVQIPRKEKWIELMCQNGWNIERNELNDSGYRFNSELYKKDL